VSTRILYGGMYLHHRLVIALFFPNSLLSRYSRIPSRHSGHFQTHPLQALPKGAMSSR